MIAYVWKLLFEHEDTNGNKDNKCVLLADEVSDWLQIWTAASSLNLKSNKAIKKEFCFLVNWLFSPNMVTYNRKLIVSDLLTTYIMNKM